ncbi:helix-turn-helix domain-containing protein [Avibacterium sp. 20-15]|uniref:helix-turn-helix domain-containing protein n=1 Tax=unclassified Avibacterium TaxID=2685287 RepID=UPI002026A1D8|nr:helix-turn-helix domain-containing protein [Avibacterium sp. 20-15]URL03754.1 helix-turn-helix domain-containing protein [Avibacterium sp. 20-132]
MRGYKTSDLPQRPDTQFEVQIISHSYQFRLESIKQLTEQDIAIGEVTKRYQISHALAIKWLKAFRERGLEGGKSSFTQPKILKPKIKKKEINVPELTDLSPII